MRLLGLGLGFTITHSNSKTDRRSYYDFSVRTPRIAVVAYVRKRNHQDSLLFDMKVLIKKMIVVLRKSTILLKNISKSSMMFNIAHMTKIS